MTTWSLEQIRAVRSLRLRIMIVDDLLRSARADILATAQARVTGELTDAARSYGVELAPPDVVLLERSSVDEIEHWGVRAFVGIWQPATKEVELRGGERDGQIYTVQNVWEPFRVPRTPPFLWSAEAQSGALLTDLADVYRVAGWREQERRWIFARE